MNIKSQFSKMLKDLTTIFVSLGEKCSWMCYTQVGRAFCGDAWEPCRTHCSMEYGCNDYGLGTDCRGCLKKEQW